MANTNLIVAGSRITAALIQQIAPICTIKGADQSVTSSTVLVNDNAMFMPVIANATYIFVQYLDYESGTRGSSDIKFQWTVPTGTFMRYVSISQSTGGNFQIPTLTGSTLWSVGGSGAGNLVGILNVGSIICGATAGTVQFQWAQNSSNATPTIMHAQSFLAAWRIT